MYKISDFRFQIMNHNNIPIPENIMKFLCDDNQYDYLYDIYVVDAIEIKEKQFTVNKDRIKICINDHLEKRYLCIPGDIRPYAVSEEIDEHHSVIQIHKAYTHMMNLDTMFASLLSLERRMDLLNQYVLHCSCVIYNEKAILFTAPSGGGKSTQADLWKKYRGARIINGDRILLVKREEKYYVEGWPICGSSGICFNESYELGNIVVLSKGHENKVDEIGYKERTKKLLSELMINFHNSEYCLRVFDFIDDLIKSVQFFHLTCNISENAVETLEKQLKEDNINSL